MLTSNLLSSRCVLLRQGLAAARSSNIRSITVASPASCRTTSCAPPPGAFQRIPIRRYAANKESSSITNEAAANTVKSSSPVSSAAASSATAASQTVAAEAGGGGTAGKIFFSSLCILTFGLGVWQTQRYFEKIDMVKKREDDLNLDPLSSLADWEMLKEKQQMEGTINQSNSKDKKNKSYRRVKLRGKFQHEHEILIGPRGPPPGALAESGPNSGRGGGGGMSSSTQGYWVITPFVVSEGETVGADDNQMDNLSDEPGKDVVAPKRGSWIGKLWGKKSKPVESEAKSSGQESSPSPSDTDNKEQQCTTVWINRGWIPRTYINNNNKNETTTWERPDGIIQLTAMESNTETPGTFSPPSRLDSPKKQQQINNGNNNEPQINKLLWMDRQAMEEMTSCPNNSHPPLFVEINSDHQMQTSYPAKPSREFVGEFKVTPEIHAGYAFTWFGLSGAGMIMTRKLLTRGR